ncbi:MAG: glycoside hydrolase family 3 C-terminal domain-containing protein, partial [Candidatus Helarchaeota archaeon]
MVKGVQSQRIAACVKHYVCNNQEINRLTVNAIVSERALQEIYLPAFEATVREADAWSFMACYNQVNGAYGCENEDLIRKRLMNDWGFRGFVVSDWFATRNVKHSENCVNGGLSLEMPWANLYKKKRLITALNGGKFSRELFNDNIRRLLRVMFLTGLFDDKKTLPRGGRNLPEHKVLARKIAEEGIILLKNDNNFLPLNIHNVAKLAVVGPNAKKKMAFGGGSSFIRPFYEITPKKGLEEKCKGVVELIALPSQADVTVIFAGLNHKKYMDAENSDRTTLELPSDQIALINRTVQENANTIVVLISGSPIAMDGWIENVPAVVQAWYAGCEGGRVIADILFGDVNPSGRLPITFPKKLKDSPAHKSKKAYPGEKIYDKKGKIKDEIVYYDEGIFVGYRYFDKHNIEPLFPFGHGLSYTTFEYSNLKLSTTQLVTTDTLSISVEIQNTGDQAGAEVVQLYLEDVESTVDRPVKELKGFQKVFLEAGEKKTVEFLIDKDDLSFYDEDERCWKAENGAFRIHIGSSSRDIRLHAEFNYAK